MSYAYLRSREIGPNLQLEWAMDRTICPGPNDHTNLKHLVAVQLILARSFIYVKKKEKKKAIR